MIKILMVNGASMFGASLTQANHALQSNSLNVKMLISRIKGDSSC